jgi:hypothetical protein
MTQIYEQIYSFVSKVSNILNVLSKDLLYSNKMNKFAHNVTVGALYFAQVKEGWSLRQFPTFWVWRTNSDRQ